MTSRRETRRAVFLDRDGVLNQTFLRKRKPHPPTDLTEVVVLEGVREACSRLRSAGFLLIMITNQPDVARGTQSLETANTINEYLRNELQLDVVKMCPHDNRDGCNCRKPKPGLLLDAAIEYGIDLDESFVVGDRWKDIDAGRSAGCRTVWLDHDYDEPTATRPDFVTRTLKEASLWILENNHDEKGFDMSARTYEDTQLSVQPCDEVVKLADLTVKIFADGADKASILNLAHDPLVSGFTTNPTLMRMARVTDYEGFARDILPHLSGKPVSFEVFSDDISDMYRQAKIIHSWGDNVYVKIPITNTRGTSTADLIRTLSADGVRVNVTAIMTLGQVETAALSLAESRGSCISVFAGRIADTGRDPVPMMVAAVERVRHLNNVELIWASPREVFNVMQADNIGCDIITVSQSLIARLPTIGRDLTAFSLDTVRMFYRDGQLAGFQL